MKLPENFRRIAYAKLPCSGGPLSTCFQGLDRG
jgi:hypothetical protein